MLAVGGAREATAAALTAANVTIPLAVPADWVALGQALRAVTMRNEARDRHRPATSPARSARAAASGATAPPELQQMVTALRARDGGAYAAARHALAEAHEQQQAQARCDELHARLSAGHPALADQLEQSATDPEWGARLATWERAWAWGTARSFFDRQRRPGRERELELDLADASSRVDKATAELAAAQAWQHCLQRMTATRPPPCARTSRTSATAARAPAGTPPVLTRRPRRLVQARGAVPAWIMPLPEVLETIPPERDSFDVVIIDEASQASLESMFLLWLAPRIIVVGDDRQCAPSAVVHGELQPIFDKLDEYLPDLPAYLRVAFTPNSSLFSLLAHPVRQRHPAARALPVHARDHRLVLPRHLPRHAARPAAPVRRRPAPPATGAPRTRRRHRRPPPGSRNQARGRGDRRPSPGVRHDPLTTTRPSASWSFRAPDRCS